MDNQIIKAVLEIMVAAKNLVIATKDEKVSKAGVMKARIHVRIDALKQTIMSKMGASNNQLHQRIDELTGEVKVLRQQNESLMAAQSAQLMELNEKIYSLKLCTLEVELKRHSNCFLWCTNTPFIVKNDKGAKTEWLLKLNANRIFDAACITLTNKNDEAYSIGTEFEVMDKIYKMESQSIKALGVAKIKLMSAKEFNQKTRHMKIIQVCVKIVVEKE